MRGVSSAAAWSAAALLFSSMGAIAAPARAETPAAAPQNIRISAASLGLATAAAPTLPSEVLETPAPLVTHAIAPAPAQSGLDGQDDDAPALPDVAERPARSLADLVHGYESADTPDEESECLARAVYWESKGEPLAGQLAVADVIINRAQSGRFASTLCGVVRQPSQFSFVRRGYIPPAPEGSAQWRTAVAIARIARENLAEGTAPQALFFHARYVHPGWRLTRVAALGNHVFYR